MNARILHGLRVVEWGGGVAAAYSGRLLAALGADVVKVEPPEGDPLRHRGPYPPGHESPDTAGLHLYLNAGKLSVVLDAASPSAHEQMAQLVGTADVFVTDRARAEWRAVGVEPESMRSHWPALVHVSLSTFGHGDASADAPGDSLDACAASGVAWVIGEPGRAPLAVPYEYADYQAGAQGAAAALAALLRVRRGGTGQWIDIASVDVLSAAVGSNAMLYLYESLQRYDRAGRRAFASGGLYPYVLLQCRDGSVCLVGRARQEWQRFVEAMGSPEWTRDPRFQDLRVVGRDYPQEADALIAPWLMRHTRAELLELAREYGFPIGPVYGMNEVTQFAQFEHRHFFPEHPHAALGSVRLPSVPWQIQGQEQALPQAAPLLGQHTHEILPPQQEAADATA